MVKQFAWRTDARLSETAKRKASRCVNPVFEIELDIGGHCATLVVIAADDEDSRGGGSIVIRRTARKEDMHDVGNGGGKQKLLIKM